MAEMTCPLGGGRLDQRYVVVPDRVDPPFAVKRPFGARCVGAMW